MITTQKLNSIFHKAGLRAAKYSGNMVRGAGDWSKGYRIVRVYKENPDYIGITKMQRRWQKKQLPTERVRIYLYGISQDSVTKALAAAEIPYAFGGTYIVVDSVEIHR